MEPQKKIILFDGYCNLCSSAVQFIIKRDKKDVFRFASLQGETGKKLTAERNIDTTEIDSILLIVPGVAYYVKSEAALKIAKHLGGLWQIMYVFIWVPSKISDIVYDFIARNRYKWFGKKAQCMLPNPEISVKFLD